MCECGRINKFKPMVCKDVTYFWCVCGRIWTKDKTTKDIRKEMKSPIKNELRENPIERKLVGISLTHGLPLNL